MPRRRRPPAIYTKTTRDGVAPASISMFQSSLYHKDNFTLPQINALDVVQSALLKDSMNQSLKYDAGKMIADKPSSGSARFCVDMPRSPQHMKYCNNGGGSSEPSPRLPKSPAEQSLELPSPARASMKARPDCLESLGTSKSKLRALFAEIDKKSTGSITHKALMFTLHERLLNLVTESELVREATSWLRDIAKEVDVDNSGCMDWKTFLDFCRRAGLIVEFQWQKDNGSEKASENGEAITSHVISTEKASEKAIENGELPSLKG